MASENLGENGRVGRRLGVILLYKLVIGMLRTNAEFIEMLTGFAFWQDLKTPCLSNSTNCSEAFPHLKLCPCKKRKERRCFTGQLMATPMATGNHWQPTSASSAPDTKLHHARVAAQMVVLSLPQNGCPAPRTSRLAQIRPHAVARSQLDTLWAHISRHVKTIL